MEPTFSLLFSLRCLLTKIGPLSHSPLGWRYHPRSAKWSPRGFSVGAPTTLRCGVRPARCCEKFFFLERQCGEKLKVFFYSYICLFI
ncbi:hypothetical protein HanRHA438_Chr16g0753461 [Helianthus annuus]|nr:hypothetical protein HanRHA438_Chr16g0753461 [Helianthus annuus]